MGNKPTSELPSTSITRNRSLSETRGIDECNYGKDECNFGKDTALSQEEIYKMIEEGDRKIELKKEKSLQKFEEDRNIFMRDDFIKAFVEGNALGSIISMTNSTPVLFKSWGLDHPYGECVMILKSDQSDHITIYPFNYQSKLSLLFPDQKLSHFSINKSGETKVISDFWMV